VVSAVCLPSPQDLATSLAATFPAWPSCASCSHLRSCLHCSHPDTDICALHVISRVASTEGRPAVSLCL
jgi:hypothetical protein